MSYSGFTSSLLKFLQQSPTPFHAVATMKSMLQQQGYVALKESENWVICEGGKYFVTRNDSSIVAFTCPRLDFHTTGWRMVGAHTDSPCLKLKPNAEIKQHGFLQLGVEVYGGVLLHTWLDRDLSIAGRVTLRSKQGELMSRLVDFSRPVAVIPNLAIHLNRTVNEGFSVNPQDELRPILSCVTHEQTWLEVLQQQLQQQYPSLEIERILDAELSLYDTQLPSLVGIKQDFISAARLDNLLSCFVGLQALLATGDQWPSLLICTDHEEVGSQSSCGANGSFLADILRRLSPNPEQFAQTIQQSLFISVDNAHGLHPNYSHKHDRAHAPMLNAGAVIKVNANQRYATNSETAAFYRQLAAQVNQNVQTFAMRADLACGSTVGPITAAGIGVPTIDIGLPTFAMHSIRELAGRHDAQSLTEVLQQFYRTETLTLSTSV